MSFIQKAVDHILAEAGKNGVTITDKIRKETREVLKEKLIEAERATFRNVVQGCRESPYPPRLNDVVVYSSGAFNLHLFAPGGTVEIDDDGKPLPYELERSRTNCSYHKGFKEDCGCE